MLLNRREGEIRPACGGIAAAAGEAPAAVRQCRRRRGARAGRQQGGGRAVAERRGDAWMGQTQEMAGGDQIPGTVPAAGASEQNRGAERREEEGGELTQGLICHFRERQGPH
jgi:hypothetical protein